jgi:hypothetical protein
MHNPKNEHVLCFEAVYDNIFAHGHAAAADSKIFIAGTPYIGKPASEKKRSVMESIRRLAISMLPFSFAT